jgi:hypothetical protein
MTDTFSRHCLRVASSPAACAVCQPARGLGTLELVSHAVDVPIPQATLRPKSGHICSIKQVARSICCAIHNGEQLHWQDGACNSRGRSSSWADTNPVHLLWSISGGGSRRHRCVRYSCGASDSGESQQGMSCSSLITAHHGIEVCKAAWMLCVTI